MFAGSCLFILFGHVATLDEWTTVFAFILNSRLINFGFFFVSNYVEEVGIDAGCLW